MFTTLRGSSNPEDRLLQDPRLQLLGDGVIELWHCDGCEAVDNLQTRLTAARGAGSATLDARVINVTLEEKRGYRFRCEDAWQSLKCREFQLPELLQPA